MLNRSVIGDELAAEVASWLDKATEADATEDAEHGPDQRGDETPDWMADKKQRLDRIRVPPAQPLKPRQEPPPLRRKPLAPRLVVKVDGTPVQAARAQTPHAHPARPSPPRSATSPIPRAGSCWAGTGSSRAITGRPLSTASSQIIVAHRLTQNASDQDGLLPLLDATADQCRALAR